MATTRTTAKANNSGITDLISSINKHFKRAVVSSAAHYPEISRVETIGMPILDYVCGGGIPIGRIIEFYGHESSGKTYAAMQAIKSFQRYDWNNAEQDSIRVKTYNETKIKVKNAKGEFEEDTVYTVKEFESISKNAKQKSVAIIDVEGTYDKDWGEYLGIDNKILLRIVPESGEEAVNVAETLLENPNIGLVVFDSVAVTKATAEIDKPMEEQTMGLQARFWNRAAAKFQAALNRNPEKGTLIVINRAYQKVGLVFGNPEEVSSGSGLKFAKSISVKFTALKEEKGTIEDKEIIIGRNVKVENKKNKTSRPLKASQYYFCMAHPYDPETGLKYGETDVANDLANLGVSLGAVKKSGNTYSFGRLKVNGRDNFIKTLRGSAALETLRRKLINL